MRDWFPRVRREFWNAAKPMAGLPITYVEIGCWIGGSAEFTCQKILTHPDSRGFGIDPYPVDWRRRSASQITPIKEAAAERLKPYKNWHWIYERSADALRNWSHGTIDLLYIDGQHNSHDVLLDFAYAFPWLRKGSIVILDDLGIGRRNTRKDGLPRVSEGLDAILAAFPWFVRRLDNPRERQASLLVKRAPQVGELLNADPEPL